VDIRFRLSGQDLTYRVQGPVRIYAADEGAGAASDFRILCLVDQTYGDKGLEPCTWMMVKDLFAADGAPGAASRR